MTIFKDGSSRHQEDSLAGAVRTYIRLSETPDLEDRVMRQVHELPCYRSRTAAFAAGLSWLVSPRRITVPIRPAYGFAAGLAAVLLVVFMGTGERATSDLAVVPDQPAAVVLVQFRLDAPEAKNVRVAGTFSEWEPRHSLTEVAPGVWTVTVPVPAGVHEYAFVVDGEEWRVDPYSPQVNDSFGGVNNRLPMFATYLTNG